MRRKSEIALTFCALKIAEVVGVIGTIICVVYGIKWLGLIWDLSSKEILNFIAGCIILIIVGGMLRLLNCKSSHGFLERLSRPQETLLMVFVHPQC